MKCVILQPSYIPWRGYFHLIQKADLFIFYDDVQYDKHGWRNRNRVKTSAGTQWLTIPVNSGGAVEQGIEIRDIAINWNTKWNRKHQATISQAYGKAPYFKKYEPLIASFYSLQPEHLADFTIETTITLARELGIEHTRFLRSSTLNTDGKKTDRLIKLLMAVAATHYISGPSSRAYLDEGALSSAGFTLEYMTYDYPEYEQLYPPYDPQVSVLDLLLMKGPDAAKYIW